MRMIIASELANYANNQKDKKIDANDIMRFPAYDAEIVRHAKWKSKDGLHFHCTWCLHEAYNVLDGKQIGVLLSPYCPECGATMDDV